MLKYNFILLLTLFNVILFTNSSFALGGDTLLIDKIDESIVIVHKVKPKQTLYSISKTYATDLDVIYSMNEGLEESGLKAGTLLKVPLQEEVRKRGNAIYKSSNYLNPIIHYVGEKETLFRITQNFSVDRNMLVLWNDIDPHQINVGQALIVGWIDPVTPRFSKDKVTVTANSIVVEEIIYEEEVSIEEPKLVSTNIELIEEPSTLTTDNYLNQYISPEENVEVSESTGEYLSTEELSTSHNTTITLVPVDTVVTIQEFEASPIMDYRADLPSGYTYADQGNGKVERTAKGVGTWFNEGDVKSDNLYALHQYAAIGTILKIKNRVNKRTTYAKVIGKIPATPGNEDVLVKVSGAVAKNLNLIDDKTLVEVWYH